MNAIREIAEEATTYCWNKAWAIEETTAWVWEEKFAEYIIEHCAKIADAASDQRIPASQYGDLIRKFKGV